MEMGVTESLGKIGSVTYSEDRMIINYGSNIYNVAYKEIVSFSRSYNGLLDSIIPYINLRTFKSSDRLYLFDTRYQRDHKRAEAI